MTYELTFSTSPDAIDYFSALSFRRLPVRGATTLAASGYADDGRAIITFARQHLADRLTYTFTEQARRA
jgi:hypothetical protein